MSIAATRFFKHPDPAVWQAFVQGCQPLLDAQHTGLWMMVEDASRSTFERIPPGGLTPDQCACTRGHLFGADGELRWRVLEGCIQAVLLTDLDVSAEARQTLGFDNTQKITPIIAEALEIELPDDTSSERRSKPERIDPRSTILWGEKRGNATTWQVERIPHMFAYQPQGSGSRVSLETRQYQGDTCRFVRFAYVTAQ